MVQRDMTPPSSLLLVTPRWARDGGVGAHIKASAAALAESGIRVGVLVARDESDEVVPGVTVFQNRALFDRSAAMDVRFAEVRNFAPDVIHLNQLDAPDVVDFLREGAPVVLSAHGYLACTAGVHYFRPGQECKRAHGPGCVPNLLLRGCAHTRTPWRLPASYRQAELALGALQQADLVMSYSQAMDRHLAINGLRRRSVVPYFPTLAPKTGTGHEQRRRVLFAGRVVSEKGLGTLIRAARHVEGEFVVCGDGWQLPSMQRLARRVGVAERFDFKGWLEPDALAEEFAKASVVAVPSLWPEPFGLVGIEAFAAGRPAVASATGGIVEWLEDGVSGLAVKPGDVGALTAALNEVLASPRRQQEMGEAGRKSVAASFSSERHVAEITRAYGLARTHWESARGGGGPHGREPAPAGVAS